MKQKTKAMSLKTRQWKSFNQSSKKKKKRIRESENSLRNLWNNIYHANIYIIGFPPPKKRNTKGAEKLFAEITSLTSQNGEGN